MESEIKTSCICVIKNWVKCEMLWNWEIKEIKIMKPYLWRWKLEETIKEIVNECYSIYYNKHTM